MPHFHYGLRFSHVFHPHSPHITLLLLSLYNINATPIRYDYIHQAINFLFDRYFRSMVGRAIGPPPPTDYCLKPHFY